MFTRTFSQATPLNEFTDNADIHRKFAIYVSRNFTVELHVSVSCLNNVITTQVGEYYALPAWCMSLRGKSWRQVSFGQVGKRPCQELHDTRIARS